MRRFFSPWMRSLLWMWETYFMAAEAAAWISALLSAEKKPIELPKLMEMKRRIFAYYYTLNPFLNEKFKSPLEYKVEDLPMFFEKFTEAVKSEGILHLRQIDASVEVVKSVLEKAREEYKKAGIDLDQDGNFEGEDEGEGDFHER